MSAHTATFSDEWIERQMDESDEGKRQRRKRGRNDNQKLEKNIMNFRIVKIQEKGKRRGGENDSEELKKNIMKLRIDEV